MQTHITDPVVADPVAWLLARGVWPVRGGAPAEKGGTEGDPTPDELDAVRNRRKWQAEQHKRDEELKAREKAVQEQQEEMRAMRRELSELRADLSAAKRSDNGNGQGADDDDFEDLPENIVDDYDTARTKIDQRDRKMLAEVRALRAELTAVKGELANTKASVGKTAGGVAAYNQVVAHNNRLIDDYVTEQKLSAAEASELKDTLHGLRIRGRGYGDYAENAVSTDGLRIWQYTNDAIAAAHHLADPDRFESAIAEQHYQRGLKERQQQARSATQAVEFGKNGVPAKNADVGELAKHFYSLSPSAGQRFIDALDVPTAKQVLEFRVNEDAMSADEGSGPPVNDNPIGVQEHVVEVGI